MKVQIRFLIVIAALLLLRQMIVAGGGDHSWRGPYWPVNLEHYQKMDSAKLLFGYPDSTNYYDTVFYWPVFFDSTYATTDSLLLDSLGVHQVKILIWSGGTNDTLVDRAVWNHVGPALGRPGPTPGPDFVSAYIDVGTGFIDSTTGAMIPRTAARFILELVGEGPMYTDDWALIVLSHSETPNSVGRVTFSIPANTIINPPGSYWKLRYEAFDGRSRSRGHIKSFIVDTIPDPLKILDATAVYR